MTQEVETVETESVESLNEQIKPIMKKYKYTMYGMIACIVLYLVGLFFIKNMWFTLAVCIPMIALAIMNSRYSKRARELMVERNKLQAKLDREAMEPEYDENGNPVPVSNADSEAIVANAESLNDLPKEYTVLDQVELNGRTIEHVILSPYGIAVVDETDDTPLFNELLQSLSLEAPVYMYQPTEDIAYLAEQIQMPKDVALSEPDIYKVLYKITGLK